MAKVLITLDESTLEPRWKHSIKYLRLVGKFGENKKRNTWIKINKTANKMISLTLWMKSINVWIRVKYIKLSKSNYPRPFSIIGRP